ncbi:DUF4224 domain-containing protein [Curvibacter sp. HBC28]|uniref:DUF4224 domain-containing protein n=1 Tax=Curvibacter microcysteis TaxID=3026419 RepID=A0ABT5MKQ6_9BURK|nr:DUF4224 domain-containing protein [Curvibacter sp. HBC28]MDD0817173.1 DUF4224 domain-containing protein [Curvibacter sp. HBC28]
MENEFLSSDEIRAMTGVRCLDDQERVLKADGIPYKRRGRRLIVSRFHTREWLSGRVVTPSRGPNLALVR